MGDEWEGEFVVKYVDNDKEEINVSDDEDLLTAYDVALKELNGNLKFIVSPKPQPKEAKTKKTKVSEKKEKVRKEKKKKGGKKEDKFEVMPMRE